MAGNQVIWAQATPGEYRVTMPGGYIGNVEIHCWGAGGAQGRGGAKGGAGGYATTITTVTEGDELIICVGGPAGGSTLTTYSTVTIYDWYNTSGTFVGSYSYPPLSGSGTFTTRTIRVPIGTTAGTTGGTGLNDGRFRGGNGGAGIDEDGDSGWAGGGGGASAVLVNNSIICVGAGGGGSSGYGEDGAGAPGNPGLAGGVYVGSATGVYPVTWGTWVGFLNSYGVWGAGQDYSVDLNFPTTGTYTFNYSVDNNGSISLDGTPIITRTGEYNYSSVYTATANVSAGSHTVRVTGVNLGGPAGVAAQILKPDTSELWNTRSLLFSSGLTTNTIGASPGNAGSPGGAGGGGYLGGGPTPGYGDDYYGAAPGGNGGQNYGSTTLAGSGIIPGGASTDYFPKASSGSAALTVAGAGQSGYVVLIFTAAVSLKYKEAGDWKNVPAIYYKANNEDRTQTRTVRREYTNVGSTTFTVPSGVTAITATVLGGGGSGSGGHAPCSSRKHYGAAGGGGQLLTQTIAVSEGQVLTVTVGDGAAATPTNTWGSSGGNSVFGTITALAGGGGQGGSPGTDYGGGNGGFRGVPNAGGGAGSKGYVKISYVRTFRITGWKRVLRIWHKVNGIWKEVRGDSNISIDRF